ncbi:MAG: hypothetical protein U0359_33700 [Byssovorax sp.]
MSDAASVVPSPTAEPPRPSAGRPRSAPRRDPDPKSPAAAPAPRRRLTDTLTGVLLFVATAGVLLSAAPSLLRAAGLGTLPRDDAEVRHGGHLALPEPPVGAPDHPIFSHGTDEDDDEGPGPRFVNPHGGALPLGPAPGPGKDPLAAPEPRDRSGEKSDGKRARPAVARRALALFSDPGGGGEILGEVRAGDLVMIGKELGDWVLVAHDGDDGVVMGWTKKSEIAFR